MLSRPQKKTLRLYAGADGLQRNALANLHHPSGHLLLRYGPQPLKRETPEGHPTRPPTTSGTGAVANCFLHLYLVNLCRICVGVTEDQIRFRSPDDGLGKLNFSASATYPMRHGGSYHPVPY